MKLMRIPLLLLFLTLIFHSCKKQELSNEFENLIGKWKLVDSYNSVAGNGTISPNSDYYFELEFLSNGKVIFTNNNGKVKERARIVSIDFFRSEFYPYPLVYKLDIKSNALFNAFLPKIQTIVLYDMYSPVRIVIDEFRNEESPNELGLSPI